MSGQLHKLLEMGVRPNITVRVVPVELGMHAACGGAFMYMEFAHFRPMIYLEADISHLLLERPEEAAAYQRIIASLETQALDAKRSRDLIARRAIELYGEKEVPALDLGGLPGPALGAPGNPHTLDRPKPTSIST